MKRETLRNIFIFLIKLLTDTEYIGLENLPTQGGIILATNHLSQIDSPVLLSVPNRTDITALVADKYKPYLFFNFIVTTVGAIWIDRSKADFTAFRLALEQIKAGKALGIAPEGTRSATGKLSQGKPGSILLAIKADVPIVPVAITGTENAFSQLLHFQRPHLRVRFGKAFHLPSIDRENRDEQMQRATDEMMCRIAALLPENYRGVYENHPRLKELLTSGI